MAPKYPIHKFAHQLKLGDVVRTMDGAFGTATVKQVTEDRVHFFRPYVQTADFAYTGGVICYVGIEEWSVDRYSNEYLVYDEKELR